MKFRSMRLLALTVLVLALLLSACSGGSASGDPLSGTSWMLASIDGSAPISGVVATAAFSDGKVSGSSGCNSYGGAYELDGEQIHFSDLVSTLMACTDPQGVMDQESAFLGGLTDAQSYQLSADKLQILTSDGKTLVFTPAQ